MCNQLTNRHSFTVSSVVSVSLCPIWSILFSFFSVLNLLLLEPTAAVLDSFQLSLQLCALIHSCVESDTTKRFSAIMQIKNSGKQCQSECKEEEEGNGSDQTGKMAVPSTSASASAASPPTKASRSQQQHVYSRRSNTLPVLLNSLLFSNRHGTVKSIKSLNVYCLSEIFNYLEYRDLATARLVCTYWNECFQFHLKRRTHFSYGKALNNLPGRKAKAAAAEVTQRRQKVPLQNNIVLNTNLLYACERCIALNGKSAKEEEEETLLLDYHELHERSPSPSACSESSSSSSGGSASESGSNSEEEGTGISSSSNSTSCFSPSSTISMTPADSVISPSPPPPSTLPSSQQSLLVNRNHDSDAANNAFSDFANRCSECQAMLTEFHQQLQQEMATAAEQDGEAAAEEGEDYFAGFIDKINVKVFEGVLALMPRLTALKLAQG